jgi:hypothetical protein
MVLNAIGYPRPLTVSGYTSDFFGTSYEYSLPENASRFNVDDLPLRLSGCRRHHSGFPHQLGHAPGHPGDTVILGKRARCAFPPPNAGTARSAAR